MAIHNDINQFEETWHTDISTHILGRINMFPWHYFDFLTWHIWAQVLSYQVAYYLAYGVHFTASSDISIGSQTSYKMALFLVQKAFKTLAKVKHQAEMAQTKWMSGKMPTNKMAQILRLDEISQNRKLCSVRCSTTEKEELSQNHVRGGNFR